MSNHHLRNKELSLKAKGLLSQMLSLPEDWDYTLAGLSLINREKIDAIREAVRELENAGYIQRSRERDEKGCLRGTTYVIYQGSQQEQAALAIHIPLQNDDFNSIRTEYSDMLKSQLAKGNNGLVKHKYITFSIEADNPAAARARLSRIETDVLNNFKVLGVSAHPLSGYERLKVLHACGSV